MEHDVYISHANKDKSIADAICQKLESARVSCWTAARDISAREDWTEATRKAIGSSRVIVLVLSENANAAPHIEREIAHAFYTGRIIIPFRVDGTFPRRDFLFYIGDVPWFNAVSPPAEQHLEPVIARIKGLMPASAGAGNAAPPQSERKKTAPLSPSNSWFGALQASHYRTLGILKWVAIITFLCAMVWPLWFALRQTKEGVSLAESTLRFMYPGPSASPDSSLQAGGNALVSKPAYTFTRFGLWKAADAGLTPLVQPRPQDTPSTMQAEQPASATPSPRLDVDQKAAAEEERLAAEDSVTVKSAQEDPSRIIAAREAVGLTSAWESHGPPLPPPGMPPAPHYQDQQYQDSDRTITWRSWQQLPAYGVRIRTGDRYLGGENWAHYLGFELAATNQKLIKVCLIHLGGETAADMELSPTARDAIAKIVNHQTTTQKGAWGWTLREIKQNGPR